MLEAQVHIKEAFQRFFCRACDARPVEVVAGQKVQLQLVHNVMMCHQTTRPGGICIGLRDNAHW